jgi:hypothetical protein
MRAKQATVNTRNKNGSKSIRLMSTGGDSAVYSERKIENGTSLSEPIAPRIETFDVRKVSIEIRLEDGSVHKREVCGRVHDAGFLGKIVESADELAALAVSRFWNHGALFEVDDGLYIPLSKVAEIRLFGEQHLVKVTTD